MSKLQDKVAVITGGSAGIGFSTAKRFVEEGAYVYITGRRQEELDKAIAQIGRGVAALQGDVTKEEDLERVFAEVKSKHGRIDVLVANAGKGSYKGLGSIERSDFDEVFDLNVKAVVFTVQQALPILSDGASVIIIGSIAGSKGIPEMSLYGAAKAAVRSFARTWSLELKSRRIRTNVLSPGPILTERLKLGDPARVDYLNSIVPIGRMGEPEEIAAVAAFLASDDASFITGIELFADGGSAQV